MRLYGSMSILGAVLILLACRCASADSGTEAPPEVSQNNGTLYAACYLRPSSTLAEGLPSVKGHVLFRQDLEGVLKVILQVSGFPETQEAAPRAVHIHQYGDLSNGCTSAGGHYNPNGVAHPHHPGDFGNFESQMGHINATIESSATLFGGLSVLGRAVVLHEGKDDLGLGGNEASLLNGNAGQRLGCCVIGISSPSLWNAVN